MVFDRIIGPNGQMKALAPIALLLAATAVFGFPALAADAAKPVVVKSLAQLQKAVNSARPGAEIVLADGKYARKSWICGKGTSAKRILVRAQTPGKVVVSESMGFQGQYVTLSGFRFVGKGTVEICGRRLRFSRCTMSDVKAGFWLRVRDSRGLEIDHCLFEKKDINRKMQRDCQLLQIKVLNRGERHRVHHNHFRDIPKGAGSNGFETIQLITVGNPSDPKPGACGTSIEHNLFERCDGEAEIISVKSNENLLRGNTFRACRGALVLRHGHGNTVVGNTFLSDGERGTYGVRLQGKDQLVAGNYFGGLGWGVSMMDGTKDTFYYRVERAGILFNTFVDCRNAMYIGINHPKYPAGTTPKDCLIAGNVFCARSGDAAAKAVHLVKGDMPVNWTWTDNVVKGKLGIDPVAGLRVADPHLRLLKNGLALPTVKTPSAKKLPEKVKALELDLLGARRGGKITLGAVQYREKLPEPAPLTAEQVGPQSGSKKPSK